MKPRYLGPYVIIRCTKGGSYIIFELDRAILRISVAAFRLIPFFPRQDYSIQISELLKTTSTKIQQIGYDIEEAEDNTPTSTFNLV